MGMINGDSGGAGVDRGLRAWALGESQWDSCCRQPVGVVSLSDSLKCKAERRDAGALDESLREIV